MKSTNTNFIKNNLPLVSLCAFGIIMLAVIAVSVQVSKVPIVMVCIMIVLETAIAACLNNLQVWIHALLMIAQIIAGILATQILFMVLICVVYVAALFALKYAFVKVKSDE